MQTRLIQSLRRLPSNLVPQAAPGTWECVLKSLPASGRVLNAGAGRGGLSLLLRDAGYVVESFDLYPEHFAAAGLDCSYADFSEALPCADACFDIVLAVEVVEHLEDPWFFMREAVRALRDGGVLIFTTPNVASLASRIQYLGSGVLPYFRDSSFFGCYHVTPVFPWAVQRWSTTAAAAVERVRYSRADWPTRADLPRHYRRWSPVRIAKKLLPLNQLTGEIACFTVRKSGAPTFHVGKHDG